MTILVGTASWTDKTLIASKLFYPGGCSSAEDRLRYYATRFPLVEVDSSYYAMPSAKNSELWVERTPPHFTFNVKAFRIFTGHQTPQNALPRDTAEELAPHFGKKKNIYYKDVPDSIRDVLRARFASAVEPLKRAGKLSALHFQFPSWVVPSPDWKRHIEECVGRLPGFQLAAEFRNRTWHDGTHDPETLAFERDLGLAHVVVDEPQNSAKSIPQVWEVASPNLLIVRLHGRNETMWDAKGLAAASDRFDYDYSDHELKVIAASIREIAPQVKTLQVIFNNNQGDQSVRNGAAMMNVLGLALPSVPT